MKIGIISVPNKKNEKIVQALEEKGMKYVFINLLSSNWEDYFKTNFDGFLIYPPSFPNDWKTIFFKRLILIEDKLKGRSVPNFKSILFYESKILMHDFYKLHNLPHVESFTSFNYKESLFYAKKCDLPVIIKQDDGSGALGVKLLKSRRALINYVHRSFLLNNKIRKYSNIKDILKRQKNNLYPYKIFFDTKRKYIPKENKRLGHVHFQKYINIKNEWRIIRIGEAYMGHKKLEDSNGYHSGSLNKEWGGVNEDLLNLVKLWSESLDLDCMCFDIFEDQNGNYYINELQVLFGTSTEEQLIVGGEEGKYVFNNGWRFIPGHFARNGCNNLRVDLLKEKMI